MAYTGRDFSIADVGESEVYSFDFGKTLDAGETIVSAEWSSSNTACLNPVGSIVTSGSLVSRRHEALAVGRVTVGCFVNTSAGNRRHLYAHAIVVNP